VALVSRRLGRDLAVSVVISGCGLLIGYLLTHQHLPSAIAIAVVPFLLWLLFRPAASVCLLAISIPFPVSLVGAGTGLNVAGSDILLTLICCMVLADALLTGETALFTALKPLALPLAPYLAWMLILAADHLGVISSLQTGQRVELFLLPLMIGAAVALRGLEIPLLKTYLLTATIFAALYPIFSDDAGGLGAQKNPAGQFIANGLLLLIAVRDLRGKMLLAAPILTLGLFWTQSRGAILSVVVGLAVLLLMHPGRDRLRFVALLIPVAAVAAGAFALLPNAAQERNTSFDVGTDSRAAYSLEIRERFRTEAWQMVHAEPMFGTGVGKYVDGVDGIRPTTTDPHQVLLFQTVEGGYPFAVAFVVLIVGSAGVVALRGRGTLLGPAGVALLLATVGHGLVDVYWVRGTPVLSWLVMGMVLGQMALAKKPVRTPLPLPSPELSGALR
jgi:hypothetical protein